MAIVTMDVLDLLRKQAEEPDLDFLREALAVVAQAVMEIDVSQQIGAGRYQRTAEREVPPVVDQNGYGLRVPGLVISPYVKQGFIDHQILSFDAYTKFIEDDFLGGQRLDPRTDRRPDSRPDVRENAPQLGDLVRDFDFEQTPVSPVILSVHPKP